LLLWRHRFVQDRWGWEHSNPRPANYEKYGPALRVLCLHRYHRAMPLIALFAPMVRSTNWSAAKRRLHPPPANVRNVARSAPPTAARANSQALAGAGHSSPLAVMRSLNRVPLQRVRTRRSVSHEMSRLRAMRGTLPFRSRRDARLPRFPAPSSRHLGHEPFRSAGQYRAHDTPTAEDADGVGFRQNRGP
jgi:hypothetical protein